MFVNLVQVLVVMMVVRLGEGRWGERRTIGGPVRNAGIREMVIFRREAAGKGFFFNQERGSTDEHQEDKASAGFLFFDFVKNLHKKNEMRAAKDHRVVRRQASADEPHTGFFFYDDEPSRKRRESSPGSSRSRSDVVKRSRRNVVTPAPAGSVPESGFFFYPGLKTVPVHNVKHNRRHRARQLLRRTQRGFFFKPHEPTGLLASED